MRIDRPARVMALVAGVAIGMATGEVARATECRPDCNAQKRACLHTARVGRLACKLDCRLTLPPEERGPCLLGCTNDSLAATAQCGLERVGCLGACNPPAPSPEPCLVGCGQRLRTCAVGVIGEVKACVAGCRLVPDRLGCLLGCFSTARTGAERCAAEFQACVAGCGGATTTTTTTAATTTTLGGPGCQLFVGDSIIGEFCGGVCPLGERCLSLPPQAGAPPGCACYPLTASCELSGGSCGGLCPSPNLLCTPPPPGSLSPLACLCRLLGSPSGAFLD